MGKVLYSRSKLRPRRMVGRRRRVFERWRDLPYGAWTCGDGRVVFFNRWYEPLVERLGGGEVREADPDEWVAWVGQEWFYDDGHTEAEKVARARGALARLGL